VGIELSLDFRLLGAPLVALALEEVLVDFAVEFRDEQLIESLLNFCELVLKHRHCLIVVLTLVRVAFPEGPSHDSEGLVVHSNRAQRIA